MDGVEIYRPAVLKKNLNIAMVGSDSSQKPA